MKLITLKSLFKEYPRRMKEELKALEKHFFWFLFILIMLLIGGILQIK